MPDSIPVKIAQTNERKRQKTYLEAIRALPDEWVDGATILCTGGVDCVVAANPAYAPMIYADEKWAALNLSNGFAHMEHKQC